MSDDYDVVIIGAGPAGLTAGLYCAQAGLKTLVLEKESLGGQVQNIEKVENYPGFPDGVSGAELSQTLAVQAMNFGLEIDIAEVVGLELNAKMKRIKTTDSDYWAPAVIIANGGRPIQLCVPGEEKFRGKGVAYCAVCEGGGFKNKIVAVAGGGNSGMTEALYLSKIASKIIVIESMPECNANALLQGRAHENQKIEIICDHRIEEILGDENISAVRLRNTNSGASTEMPVDGVLVHIGWRPHTKYIENVIPLDNQGHVIVNSTMETQYTGVFAAGDIRKGSCRQITTAVGDGTVAALSAQKYLRDIVDA